MNEQKSSGFHYGYLIVLSCCILMLGPCCFSFNTAGIFYNPVSKELGVGKGTFGMYMTVEYLTMFLILPFAGRMLNKLDARTILSTAVIMVSGSLMAMSTFHSVYSFYVAGFIIGVANAWILYLAVPVLIGRWFKKNVGLWVGLCMAFTGIGGMIFNPIGGQLITNYGWRTGYLTFGIIAAVIALPFTLFVIRSYPSDKGLQPYGEGEVNESEPVKLTGVSARTAIKSPALYMMALYAGLVNLGLTINYYLPSYVGTLGMPLTVGATLASVVMFGSLLGKVGLGWLNDKSVPVAMVTGLSSGIIGLGALMLLADRGLWVILIAGAFFGIFFASATTTTPMMARSIFGDREYSQICSYVTMACAFLAAFGSAIWGFIFDATGSYLPTLGIAICLVALCFVLGTGAMKVGKDLPRE